MRITSKGQVTIPQEIRERFGLAPGTDVEFVERDGEVVVRRATRARRERGAELVARARGRLGRGGMSTEELLALTRGEG